MLAFRNELRNIPSFSIFCNWYYMLFYYLQNSSVRLFGPDTFFETIFNFYFNFFNGYRHAEFSSPFFFFLNWSSFILFFFFSRYSFLIIMYLFIFGCVGSSFL